MWLTWANQKLFPVSFIFIIEKSLTFLSTWSSLMGSISNNPVSSVVSAVRSVVLWKWKWIQITYDMGCMGIAHKVCSKGDVGPVTHRSQTQYKFGTTTADHPCRTLGVLWPSAVPLSLLGKSLNTSGPDCGWQPRGQYAYIHTHTYVPIHTHTHKFLPSPQQARSRSRGPYKWTVRSQKSEFQSSRTVVGHRECRD